MSWRTTLSYRTSDLNSTLYRVRRPPLRGQVSGARTKPEPSCASDQMMPLVSSGLSSDCTLYNSERVRKTRKMKARITKGQGRRGHLSRARNNCSCVIPHAIPTHATLVIAERLDLPCDEIFQLLNQIFDHIQALVPEVVILQINARQLEDVLRRI